MAVSAASPPSFLNGPSEANVNVIYNYTRFCQESKRRWTPLRITAVPSGTFLQTSTIYPRKGGLLAALRISYEGTFQLTKGGGALALPLGWPYSLLRTYRLLVNGETIQRGSGLDLWIRQQMRTTHFAGTTASFSVPNTDGTYTVRIYWYLPIEHDAITMAGVLFTPSDAVNIQVDLDWASQAEVFTLTGGAAITVGAASVKVWQKDYDIPQDLENGKPVLILPRMDLIHKIITQDIPVTNGGVQHFDLERQPIQLLRLWMGFFNGSSDWVDPAANMTSVGLTINTTTVLQQLAGYIKAEEDSENYNGRLNPNFWGFDLQAENAPRDSMLPRAYSELQADVDFGSTSVNVGSANLHVTQEGLATVAVRAPLNTTQKAKAA
jgi:hypothetical protein